MNERMVLQLQGLTKRFGSLTAVNELNLSIPAGSVYGLLGPNGSGKTTTLGMLLGVTSPSAGTFAWFPQDEPGKHQVGAILETPNFMPYLSGWDNLKIVAKIKGITSREKLMEKLTLVELHDRKGDRFQTYSLGMKQRLAIAAALLNDPEVLILDEPTNGLDPQGIAEIRNLIRKIAAEGTTIVLASHLLDEVEKVCSHVAILKRGKLLYSGYTSELNPNSQAFELIASSPDQLMSLVKSWPETQQVALHGNKVVAEFTTGITAEEVNKRCFHANLVLTHLVARQQNLEEQFLNLTSAQ